jgi:hypothetical protein
MNGSTSLWALLGTFVVFLITNLNAYARQSRSVKLAQTVSLVGTDVAPGVYQVNWRGHSPKGTVTLQAGKRVVAAATGKWVERHVNYDRDALICQTGEGGLGRVVEMQFAGKSQVLVLDESRSEAQSPSVVIPLCVVSARGNEAAFTPGDGCQHIRFLGKPSANRVVSPAVPYFGDGFPQPNHTVSRQRK